MKNGVRFMFLRNTNQQPVGCLAFNVSGNQIVYGLSVLNPKDKFDRTLARDIAEARWVGNYKNTIVPFTQSPYTMHEVSKAVMQDLFNNPFAPARARKAAKLWLTNNDTR